MISSEGRHAAGQPCDAMYLAGGGCLARTLVVADPPRFLWAGCGESGAVVSKHTDCEARTNQTANAAHAGLHSSRCRGR